MALTFLSFQNPIIMLQLPNHKEWRLRLWVINTIIGSSKMLEGKISKNSWGTVCIIYMHITDIYDLWACRGSSHGHGSITSVSIKIPNSTMKIPKGDIFIIDKRLFIFLGYFITVPKRPLLLFPVSMDGVKKHWFGGYNPLFLIMLKSHQQSSFRLHMLLQSYIIS